MPFVTTRCLKPMGRSDHTASAFQDTAIMLMHTAHDSITHRCLGFQSDPSHHGLSGMSAAKAHNLFCESLCFLKVATLDGSLYNAAFTCSHQRPDGGGIFRSTTQQLTTSVALAQSRLDTMSCKCKSSPSQ